jgi:hypothetical protein
MTHNTLFSNQAAWCLPYHDRLTNKLGFVIWNMDQSHVTINVKLIYNNNQVIHFCNVLPQHWVIRDIDDFDKSKNLIVILNDKIRNVFDFEKDGESFKQVSFREEFDKKYLI